MFGFTVEDVFYGQFEIFECTIEVEASGNIYRNIVQAPRALIVQDFLQFVQQAINDSKSVRVKLSMMVECFNEWTGEVKMREASVKFMNKRYVEDMEM